MVWAVASLMGLLHKHLPQAESKVPLLDKLDLPHSQAARLAIDTNFLGNLKEKFGSPALPDSLRKAADEAAKAAERAATAAKEAAKAAVESEAAKAAEKAAHKAVEDAKNAAKK